MLVESIRFITPDNNSVEITHSGGAVSGTAYPVTGYFSAHVQEFLASGGVIQAASPVDEMALVKAERNSRIDAYSVELERYRNQVDTVGLTPTLTAQQYQDILLDIEDLRQVPQLQPSATISAGPNQVVWPTPRFVV